MKSKHPYYAQLIFAEDFDSLKRTIDDLIELGTFEAVNTLNWYFHYGGVKESRLYLIERLSQLADFPQRYRFLTEISYQKDYDLKMAVLKTVYDLRHPAFAHRLISIFTHTPHEEKKIIILKTLIHSGVSLFASKLIDAFAHESFRVRQYLLTYLVNIPFLNEEYSLKILTLINRVLEETNDEVVVEKLCHHLWMLSIHHPGISKRCYKLFQKYEHRYSLFSQLFESVVLEKKTKVSAQEAIAALENHTISVLNRLRFSKEALLALIPTLKEKLSVMDKHFSKEHHLFIWNLVRLNHPALFDALIDAFESASHYYFKQAILDVVTFFPMAEERKKRLYELCEQLLQKRDHSRIFETLTRTLITLESQRGLKRVHECFEDSADGEQKASILLGVYRALVDFGFGKSLTALDHYTLNMLVGSSIDFILQEKITPRNLWQRTYRLVALLRLDTYEDELIRLSERDHFNADLLKALLCMNKEKSFDQVIKVLTMLIDTMEEHEDLLHEILGEIRHVSTKLAKQIPRDLLMIFLETPQYAIEVMHIIGGLDLSGFDEKLLRFREAKLFHHRVLYLQQLAKRPEAKEEDAYLKSILETDDAVLVEQALKVILAHGSSKALLAAYNLILKKNRLDKFIPYLETLDLLPEHLREHLLILEKSKSVWPYEQWKKVLKVFSTKLFDIAIEQVKEKPAVVDEKIESTQPPFLLPKEKEKVLKETEQVYSTTNQDAEHLQEKRFHFQQESVQKDTQRLFKDFKDNLQSKWQVLLANEPFKTTLTQVFKHGIHVQEFLSKTPPWNDIALDLNKLDAWIEFIVSQKQEAPLDSLEDVLHLFALILHDNEFYSLSNPMGLNLASFKDAEVPERLARLCGLADTLLKEENLGAFNEFKKLFTQITQFLKDKVNF